MRKLNTASNRITLLFVLIFLVGVLGFVAFINNSLEKNHSVESTPSPIELSIPE